MILIKYKLILYKNNQKLKSIFIIDNIKKKENKKIKQRYILLLIINKINIYLKINKCKVNKIISYIYLIIYHNNLKISFQNNNQYGKI